MYIIAIIDVDFFHVYLLFFFLALLACSNLFLSFLMIGPCFSYVDLYPLIIDHVDLNFISLMTKLRLCLFLGIHFPGNHFPNFTVCLTLEKLVNEKHFPVKGKFSFVSRKMFSWKIWAENTFRKL